MVVSKDLTEKLTCQSVWFVQIANNYGQNKEYSQEERDTFRNDPKSLVAHAKVSNCHSSPTSRVLTRI